MSMPAIHPWIMIIITFLAAIYLFIVISMAFRERTMVSSFAILMVIIFLVTYFRPDITSRFALSGARLSGGAGYTLVTYMFMHADISHIFLNLLALLFFGYHIEKEFAGPAMIMIFITSGLIGGAAFIITSPAHYAVVGASGGVFGLMAYLTLIRPFKISPMPFLVPIPVSLAAAVYTVITIPLMIRGDMGIIAHNAHIGGMLGGAAMAFGMNRQQALKGLAVFTVLILMVLVLPRILFG